MLLWCSWNALLVLFWCSWGAALVLLGAALMLLDAALVLLGAALMLLDASLVVLVAGLAFLAAGLVVMVAGIMLGMLVFPPLGERPAFRKNKGWEFHGSMLYLKALFDRLKSKT